MRKDKIIFTAIGLIVLAIILIPMVTGVVGGIISVNKANIPKENPLTISNEENWLSYKNEEKKFSLQYPPEMYVSEKAFTGFTTTFLLNDLKNLTLPEGATPRIQVFASDRPIKEALKEVNENRNKEQFPEFKPFQMNNYEAYQTKANSPEIIFTHTLVGDDKGSYLIELFTIEKENKALVDTYDKLLKSFRFER